MRLFKCYYYITKERKVQHILVNYSQAAMLKNKKARQRRAVMLVAFGDVI